MAVLLLSLRGPYQSWGLASRFSRRDTNRMPTKSAVLGLLASAQGRTREDPIEDFAGLRFAVRADQPGVLVRDFQTERPLDWQTNAKSIEMPITQRFYLCDAAFLVALSAQGKEGLALLKGLRHAVSKPVWPLYLGRRSCPPSPPVKTRLLENVSDPVEVLRHEPWIASDTYRHRHQHDIESGRIRFLDISADADLQTSTDDPNQILDSVDPDQPLSFSVRHRRYAARRVIHTSVALEDLDDAPQAVGGQDSNRSGHSSDGASPAFTDDDDPMGF